MEQENNTAPKMTVSTMAEMAAAEPALAALTQFLNDSARSIIR